MTLRTSQQRRRNDGEGPEHRRLKGYVAAHPETLGLGQDHTANAVFERRFPRADIARDLCARRPAAESMARVKFPGGEGFQDVAYVHACSVMADKSPYGEVLSSEEVDRRAEARITRLLTKHGRPVR